MHRLVLKDMPERYTLSFNPETTELHVTADQQVRNFISHLISEHPGCVDLFDPAIKLQPFIPPDKDVWGFGPRIRTTTDERTVTWTCPLPPAIRCDTESDDAKPDHPATYEVSASLQVLFNTILQYKEGTSRIPQVAHVSLYLRAASVYGAPLNAVISPLALKTLKTLCQEPGGHQFMEQVTEQTHLAIARAQQTMLGWSADFSYRSSRTLFLEDEQISLMTYGSAVDLSTDVMHMDTPGMELVSHNTNVPCQQLSLLSGFASLCDILRPHLQGLSIE